MPVPAPPVLDRRALGLVPPDCEGLFVGLADDLHGAGPRHHDPSRRALAA